MRDILFRGKRIDNGEWYYGAPIFLSATSAVMMKSALPEQFCVLGERFDAVGQFVDIATIGQYTGLCDKNDKKIIEGDIVLVEGRTGTVVYSEENCVWYVDIEYGFEPPLNDYDRLYIEVIGNIHDNPELLEVDDGT